ncbi:MAG: type II toxin-antitoxin system HicB family antitoxin [Methanophagales archaeon]|nr:type II toxin-antitoxin system HicB family antitoxin [Methanophagales archaeon]
MRYKVVIKKDLEDGGYNVSCPALPGCHSQGDTVEEARENIKDAIQGCMAVINQRALKGVKEQAIEVSV